MPFHYFALKENVCLIFSKYLCLEDISRFDVAVCNHGKRPEFLDWIKTFIWPGNFNESASFQKLSWLSTRQIKIENLKYDDPITEDVAVKISRFSVHLNFLAIGDKNVGDADMIRIVASCPNIDCLSLTSYTKTNITDGSLIS
mmetsp:Transcript_3208/g.3368  ORF Transcript_3208/g.3368 Transcript_3208/m.3368 type:complete len:143 (-) Transcript_3208:271-699(-)